MADAADRLTAALADRYSIERELGAGGMATVYLAEDLKHHRRVALKVLKPELAAVVGAERFLAEIRTTANLQHPGILPLYDSGEADKLLYYVMPYVEGETLRDRLDAEKQLSVDEAVRIAAAVARALDFAHQRGVVHRDIKPGNILFQGGQPVVADFGIALAVGAGSGARLTETGLSVGTPYYMSPEQATGDQRVGPRSDIYALGCVLYEMLTGDPPYTGSTAQAVLGQIITGEAPAVRKKRPSVPVHVDAVIRRALEKLPADRFETARAFADALANPGFTHGADPVVVGRAGRAWYRRATAVGLTAMTVVALGLAAALMVVTARGRSRPGGSIPVVQFALSADPAVHIDTYTTRPFAVSPDGRTVVFRAWTDTTPTQLWVRRLDDATPHPLAGTEGGMNPAISPDGAWVAFVNDGYLIAKVRVGGGDVSTVVGQRVTSAALNWLSDHEILFEDLGPASEGIRRVGILSGTSATAVPLDSAAGEIRQRRPFALRDAGVVVYESTVRGEEQGTLVAYRLSDGYRVRLGIHGVGALAFVDGRLVYSLADGTLMAVPFDASGMRGTGTPVELSPRVVSNGAVGTAVGMSASGALVYRAVGASAAAHLELVDTTGRAVSASGNLNVVAPPRFSPDGRRIAVLDGGTSEAPGYLATGDLWVVNATTGVSTRVTTDASVADFSWFPGGRRIAFLTASGRSSTAVLRSQLRSVGVNGSEPATNLQTLDEYGAYLDVAPDGRSIVVAEMGAGETLLRRWIGGSSRVDTLLASPDRNGGLIATYPRVSPDGRWVAFVDNWTSEVWVRSLDDPTLQQVSASGTNQTPVVWGPDSRHLYYVGTAGLVDIELQTSPTLAVLRRHTLRGVLSGGMLYDMSPDGKTFVVARTPSGANDVLVAVGWLDEARKAWQGAKPGE